MKESRITTLTKELNAARVCHHGTAIISIMFAVMHFWNSIILNVNKIDDDLVGQDL